MTKTFNPRTLSLIAGSGYWVIFFAAIFANFFVLESIRDNPLETIQKSNAMVRVGILAFMLTVVFDVIVAWALYELYKRHPLSFLSTLFRMMHASIMGVAIFALPAVLNLDSNEEILEKIDIFSTTWLLGLFFFGVHIIILGFIINKPRVIMFFLILAGTMYMVDTAAHFTLSRYEEYASILLVLVLIPSILGEMSLAIWLLVNGGKK
tara:strand:+ start:63 stop:686 length:624 start_codon:yes stop_codon:yes gene_type:complete